jgi:3',5'-cyclic AMP phosphodiesterase CpdA
MLARIVRKGRGAVVTPGDFADLGPRASIDQALSRSVREGRIRRLTRGVYDYPRRHPRLGLLAPSMDDVARALAGRDASRIQPSGAHAANLLGLSDQVPVRAVYLTDGRSRTVQVGRRTVVLKKTTPRNMATAGRISGTVIQALRWLGRRHVDDRVIATLRKRLGDQDREQLLADIRFAPAWIAAVVRHMVRRETLEP